MNDQRSHENTCNPTQLNLLALADNAVSHPQLADSSHEELAPERPDEPELHRHHMALNEGNSVDFLSHRVRIESGTFERKRRIAYRIALAWNLCEGWPTEALDAGVLQDFGLAVEALVQSLQAELLSPASVDALRKVEDALRKQDRWLDRRNGRLHDCHECLERSNPEPAR